MALCASAALVTIEDVTTGPSRRRVAASPDLVEKIQAARRSAKVSQKELADDVGCSQAAISKLERGDVSEMNAQVLKRIQERLGIHLVDIDDDPVALLLDIRHEAPSVYARLVEEMKYALKTVRELAAPEKKRRL